VEIHIERGADGAAASVQVLAERPETLALLQRDARDLDRTLAQAGIAVAGGGLQFGLAGGGREQPNHGRPSQGQGQGGGPRVPAEVTRRALAVLSLLDIAV
jgi:Meckel syndrome type 1 protein